ncbi:protein PAXX isoform X2 [Pezoporus occidentalis]|uniref:protein PAXX isoform X2 n=1 Tax=Pezoporus occidentalis TaxID=407982 RepID=UPI002F912CC5
MAEPAGPFHRLQAGSCRYLCYCGPGGSVYVTDALEVWAGGLGAPPSLGCRCQPEEHGAKLSREALGRGAGSLSPGEAPGTLRLQGDAPCSALDLRPLPAGEARSQLRALLFGMAGRIESLERRLSVVETLASSCSPKKNTAQNQQQFLPGKQLPGGTSPGPAVCLLFPRRLLFLCPCALQDTLSPLDCGLFWHRRGQGSAWCLVGVWDVLCSDPKPWKNRGAGSDLPARRKIPGESLINPGFKSKKAPSGVDFEDS